MADERTCAYCGGVDDCDYCVCSARRGVACADCERRLRSAHPHLDAALSSTDGVRAQTDAPCGLPPLVYPNAVCGVVVD